MIAINRPYMIYGLFLGFLDFLVVCFVEVWFWSLGLWHLKFESCGNTISALVQGYPPFLGIMVVGNPLDNKVVALEEPPLDSNWDTSSGRSLLFRQLRRGVHCRDFNWLTNPRCVHCGVARSATESCALAITREFFPTFCWQRPKRHQKR